MDYNWFIYHHSCSGFYSLKCVRDLKCLLSTILRTILRRSNYESEYFFNLRFTLSPWTHACAWIHLIQMEARTSIFKIVRRKIFWKHVHERRFFSIYCPVLYIHILGTYLLILYSQKQCVQYSRLTFLMKEVKHLITLKNIFDLYSIYRKKQILQITSDAHLYA